MTANGYKNIEDVEVGDKVIATNPETGETEIKEVKRTFENKTFELLHLTVNGEVITSTPGHKYYAPEKGWTSAIDLAEGDLLQLVNGEYVVVECVQHEILEEPVTIYNFEVEDFHTYYVGEQSVLVHNRDCGGTIQKLYASGNMSGDVPTAGRLKDFGIDGDDASQIISPGFDAKGRPYGASSFEAPEQIPLKRQNVYELPEGTVLPDEIAVVQDHFTPGHNTFVPTREMTFGEFQRSVQSLPWKKVGYIDKGGVFHLG